MSLFFLFLSTGSAHKPSFGDTYISPESAFEIQDPNISIVLYDEVTCENPHLWMSFEAMAGMDFYVQGGVPVIERLEDYKPTIAVLAPGLPQADLDLPFEIPSELGVILIEPEESPSEFYEPFTQTTSWIWIEESLILPKDGIGYVVAWNEEFQTGKLWVAVGLVEDFSDVEPTEFISWNESVNNYHETGKFEIPYPIEESFCLDEQEQISKHTSVSGCQHNKHQSFNLYLFCFSLIFWRRR